LASSADCVRNDCFIYRQQLVLDFEKAAAANKRLEEPFVIEAHRRCLKSLLVSESAHAQLKNSVGSTFFRNVVTPHTIRHPALSAALFVKSCMQISVPCMNMVFLWVLIKATV
jgi:hypothetical protein